jgi:hypothetical protein
MAQVVTLTYTNSANNATTVRYLANVFQAERHAREMLRTYRTDTAIKKRLTPGQITLRHTNGSKALITWTDIAE